MALSEIKNTLEQNETMPTLKLENDDYRFTIFYVGSYIDDRCSGSIDPHKIRVKCKPKSSDILIAVNDLTARIDMLNSFIFDIYNEKQLDKLGRQLRCAMNTLKELQPVLDKYFA